MALLPLFFDVVSKRLVFSESNPKPFALPDLHQEDGVTIAFRALKRIREAAVPFFERITLSGYDLLISVGSAGVINASATSWTPSDSDTLLTGTLDLNTSQINALADNTQQIFEVRLFDGVGYYRGHQTCNIRKSVATTGTLQAVVNDIALGKREARRTYMTKELAPGEGIVFTSEDETQRKILRLGNDGSARWEAIA